MDIDLLGGTKAHGFDGEIGSIEPSKKADIILLDTERPMTQGISPRLAVQD